MKTNPHIDQLYPENKSLLVSTLGSFSVIRDGIVLSNKDWGRDKTAQLFQYLITSRSHGAIHKEKIMDRLWDDYDDQTFKVAMHGINKVLEPERPSRQEPIYIVRNGLTYQLNMNKIWIDAEAIDVLITYGNKVLNDEPKNAISAFQKALSFYKGMYLPNRIYEDWSTTERERIQILCLNTFVLLAELLIDSNPQESIRLCEEALLIDEEWEDAYRTVMEAYLMMGNRPMVVKTYKRCESILRKAYGLEPLPATKALIQKVKNI